MFPSMKTKFLRCNSLPQMSKNFQITKECQCRKQISIIHKWKELVQPKISLIKKVYSLSLIINIKDDQVMVCSNQNGNLNKSNNSFEPDLMVEVVVRV